MPKDDLAEIEALLERATPGEWMVQDGCSWRRIGTHFHDGDVLCPSTYSTTDNHPDLTARDGRLYDNLRLIIALKNAAPTLIARLRAAETERDEALASWRTVEVNYADVADKLEVSEERVAALEEGLRPFAAQRTCVEVLQSPERPPWFGYSPEKRIAMIGERRRAHDDRIQRARALLSETNRG